MEKESQVRLINDRFMMLEEENKRRFGDKDKRIKMLEEEVQSLSNRVKSNLSTPRNNQNNQNFDTFSPGNNQELRSLRDKLSQK